MPALFLATSKIKRHTIGAGASSSLPCNNLRRGAGTVAPNWVSESKRESTKVVGAEEER
jgi:hypothetical protein